MTLPVARIAVPDTARKGDIVEVKTLARHPMETGYRRDDLGQPIPRDIIASFKVTYNGVEIFQTELSQGIAANPFIAFTTVATESGEIVGTWTDLSGKVLMARATISVT